MHRRTVRTFGPFHDGGLTAANRLLYLDMLPDDTKDMSNISQGVRSQSRDWDVECFEIEARRGVCCFGVGSGRLGVALIFLAVPGKLDGLLASRCIRPSFVKALKSRTFQRQFSPFLLICTVAPSSRPHIPVACFLL